MATRRSKRASSSKQSKKSSSKTRTSRSKRPVRKSRTTATSRTVVAKSTQVAAESPFTASDAELERWLATGEHHSELVDYFGPEEVRELEALAREGMRSRTRGGPTVLVLPGIMGSKLGKERKLLPDDVLWIDPLDTTTGRLMKLALPDGGAFRALGVINLAYLKMKLRLKIAGFDASFYPFDWRYSIAELGKQLAKTLAASPTKVSLVAHSMGGLVSRAALSHTAASANVDKLVMLGTPNFGSFSPVQALRGEHSLAAKIAAVDLSHSAIELAKKMFATFPGLIEMLPSPDHWSGIDLYDASKWPDDKPKPSQKSLTSARNVQKTALAGADDRFYLIAGVNQETVVDFAQKDGKWTYGSSFEGDGTVPLNFCRLPNTKTYYIEEGHGSLPNNSRVERAVIDLLRSGETTQLLTSWIPPATRSRKRTTPAETPRVFEGRRGPHLTSSDRRLLLAEFAAPSSRTEAVTIAGEAVSAPPGPGLPHHIRNVEVTRRRAHAVEICLAHGSITEARTRAIALGVFSGVDPAGAAGAVDEQLDGAVKEAVTRRMFSAEVGSLFVVPVGRHRLYADSVVFAGLGAFDTFNPDSQQFVAENMIRMLLRSNVEEFATVLFGASSGWSVETALANQLRGFVRGILDTDHGHRMRRITICELDLDRYRAVKEEVYRLASTELFDKLVVTFDEDKLEDPPAVIADSRRSLRQDPDLAYLIVNREENPDPSGKQEASIYRASVLTRGSKATVVSGSCRVNNAELDAHLKKLQSESLSASSLSAFGEQLGKLVLQSTVRDILATMRNCHLAVVHDAVSSRIPWETVSVDGWFPARDKGVSRRYSAENLSVGKWLEERRQKDILSVLLIANPTGDLANADAEAERILKSFSPTTAVRINSTLRRERATRDAILEELGSGKYDVVHYAGHAFFDPQQRSRSGIICAGNQVLSGAQLAELRSLPSLAFFNACEAARTRKGTLPKNEKVKYSREVGMTDRVERNVGLAEAFLRGGIANYVGTYWPVGDAAASSFATTFYSDLVNGGSLGSAIQKGRKQLFDSGSVDWANYVHYGSQDFMLKVRK
jgi:pimeloyl-ACP methyl ester carboxylesterase